MLGARQQGDLILLGCVGDPRLGVCPSLFAESNAQLSTAKVHSLESEPKGEKEQRVSYLTRLRCSLRPKKPHGSRQAGEGSSYGRPRSGASCTCWGGGPRSGDLRGWRARGRGGARDPALAKSETGSGRDIGPRGPFPAIHVTARIPMGGAAPITTSKAPWQKARPRDPGGNFPRENSRLSGEASPIVSRAQGGRPLDPWRISR